MTSAIARLLRRRSPVDDAIATIEVHSGTDWPVDLPVRLDDEDQRIVGLVANGKADDELQRAGRRVVSQGPTRAYCVRDVIIADGAIMSAKSFEILRPETRRLLLRGPVEQYGERTLCSSSISEQYWGHWLHDVPCHELLAMELGAEPLVLRNRSRQHEDGYRAMLDMPARTVALAHVEKLWLLEDYEINAGRGARLEKIKAKLRNREEMAGPTHVYLKRGDTGVGRKLLNENEIVAALEVRGFTILAPEQMESAAIVAGLRSARLVVTVEGSAIAHATLSMAGGGGILVIEPPKRFNMLVRTYCAALGLKFGYTVGDVGEGDGLTQPVDRLLRTIDMMDDAIAR